jgi:hypothetical protein
MGDNIKIDFKETGCEDVDWIHVTLDRVLHYNETLGITRGRECLGQLTGYCLLKKEFCCMATVDCTEMCSGERGTEDDVLQGWRGSAG